MIFQHKSQFVRECVPIEAKKRRSCNQLQLTKLTKQSTRKINRNKKQGSIKKKEKWKKLGNKGVLINYELRYEQL